MNGFGTIGRRVALAILKQPDMQLAGVTKLTADYRVDEAAHKGMKVFSIGSTRPFEDAGFLVEGSLNDMLKDCDVVVDCSPKGKGKENLELYKGFGVKAIFQGGERHELTGFSYNSDCNHDNALSRDFIRVVSCNTTGLCRMISTLDRSYKIRKVRACLVRRSADQSESEDSILNAWAPDASFPTHHSVDIKTVLPDISITTLAGIAPMTLMHGHMLFFEFERPARDTASVIEALKVNPRILICEFRKGLTTTAKLKDIFALNNRSGDIYEVCAWKETIGIDEDGEVGMHIAIDQQADVIPENIDAVRAVMGIGRENSVAMTNQALEIGAKQPTQVYPISAVPKNL